MKVLIATNGTMLGNLTKVIDRHHWQAIVVENSDDATSYLREVDFQLIFCVVREKGHDRFEILRALGQFKNCIPKIALLKHNTPMERTLAWQSNVLACLQNDASTEEIEMAALSTLRFTSSITTNTLRCGSIELDLSRRVFGSSFGTLALPRMQHLLLERLILSKEMTVSRRQLMNHLYGFCDFPEQKVLDVMVCRIRSKLKAHGVSDVTLQTVRGIGYRLAPNEESKIRTTTSAVARFDANLPRPLELFS